MRRCRADGGGYKSPFLGEVSIGAHASIKAGISYSVVGAGAIKLTDPRANRDAVVTVKRDPAGRQIVTIDDHTGFEINIPLIDFEQLATQANNISNLITALTTPVPLDVANQGPQAEELYRKMLANGMSEADARARTADPRFTRMAQAITTLIAQYGSVSKIPNNILQTVTMGEVSLYTNSDGTQGFSIPCGQFSTSCNLTAEEFAALKEKLANSGSLDAALAELAADPRWFAGRAGSLHAGLQQLANDLGQLIACTAEFDPGSVPDLLNGPYGAAIRAFAAAPSGHVSALGWRADSLEAFSAIYTSGALPSHYDGLAVLTSIETQLYIDGATAIVLQIGEVAIGVVPVIGDAIDAYELANAIREGNVTGIVLAGIGFVPAVGDWAQGILRATDDAIAAGQTTVNASTLFRGTSEGWPGSPGVQHVGVTPTSTDPIVATCFGTQCETMHGNGVVQIARPGDLNGVETIAGNALSQLELEVGVVLSPEQFAGHASLTISAADARAILRGMGIAVPERIGQYDLTPTLNNTPRLTAEQTAEFLAHADQLQRARQ